MSIRPLRHGDLERCLAIVDEAWDFSGRLRPAALADLALRVYTAGSLAQSRYASAVDRGHGIDAFLFGRAGIGAPCRTEFSGIRGLAKGCWELATMRGLRAGDKLGWLGAVVRHERARAAVDPVGDGEVTLFAAAEGARGRGHGGRLMDAYVEHCRVLGIRRVTLETDLESSVGFYDHYGFEVVGEFESPLNRRYGGTGRSFVYALRI